MPAIPLHIGSRSRDAASTEPNPLPNLLHTPSGLAIVEIQGTINAPVPDSESAEPVETPVGKLIFPFLDPSLPADDTSWMKRVYLYVGKHQRLTGEVKKLAKPYGLIRKREPDPSAPADSEELEIVEIIRYKIMFSHRPEPVGEE